MKKILFVISMCLCFASLLPCLTIFITMWRKELFAIMVESGAPGV